MQDIVQKLFSSNKGIFASDASFPSLEKRFSKYSITSTQQSRSAWRNLLYTTPELEKYISGIILFEEALDQKTHSGKNFPELLEDKGIIVGIKVDQGIQPFGKSNSEFVTAGIDDLSQRLEVYKQKGACFTKWRCAFTISDSTPTKEAISYNIDILVQFAQLSLEQEMVPIVEPEVLMEGNHDIDFCADVTRKILSHLFEKLARAQIPLKQTILKTNMIIAGSKTTLSTPQKVGEKTVSVITAAVPKDIGGIVFLSGGQDSKQATHNLNEIASLGPHPWPITFSFERALEEPALSIWQGKDANIDRAQQALLKRARLNSLAVKGGYRNELEKNDSWSNG